MKLVLENWRKFVTEEETAEQPQTNYQKVLNYLNSQSLEVVEDPPSTLRIKTDEPRIDVKNRIEGDLRKLGLKHVSESEGGRGSSFGRFQLQASKKDGGSVYVLIKPKKGGPAQAGSKYEDDVANLLKPLLPSIFTIKTAKYGSGTDLVIKSPNQKFLHMELKTSVITDFGQFKIKYNPSINVWETIKTKDFLKNQDLFQGIFDDTVEPQIKNKRISVQQDDPFKYDDEGFIVALVANPKTLLTKQRLQQELFDGKESLYYNIDPNKVQEYYAKKGDALISIENKGVYALSKEAAQFFGLKELKECFLQDTPAKVRLRIKPSMGEFGHHVFNCALKVQIQPSDTKLTDPSFLQKIVDYLT